MSTVVIDQALSRIVEHVKANTIPSVSLVLHGGEPLLAGLDTIEYIFENATRLCDGLCELELSLQSNGLLVTDQLVDLLAKYDARIGISIDGFKEANARRKTRAGRSSFEEVEKAIQLLNRTDAGRRALFGFLCVIDVEADPIAVYEYLASLGPRAMDFLLPLATHDSYPNGKQSFSDTPYGDWLIAIFDHWFHLSENKIRIKYFNNIITLLIGGESETESLGHPAVNIVTVETDGSLEAVDTIKVAFDGAPALHANVFTSSFDDVISHPAILSRMQGVNSLASECQTCPLADVCGGGYLPNRFSAERGFDNPSVFCHDIAKLVLHIRGALLDTHDTQILPAVIPTISAEA
jgi:uncharacterized protein